MNKASIKRGTIGIITFSVIVIIVMVIIANIKNQSHGVASESEDALAKVDTAWCDTLTNNASQLVELMPMDNRIEAFMQKWNLRGVSLAITRNDSLLWAKGYGYADKEANKPMQPTSIMRMASVSKLVTAVAIMKLVEQGKINLNAKVFGSTGILNDTTFTNSIRDQRILDITVDNLLLHKGGFGLGAGDPMFTTRDIMQAKHLSTPPDNNQLTKIVLGRKLAFQPGNGRKYSNFGYMLLSLIIEKVTDQKYWDYVTDNVLKPAGIVNMRPGTNYYGERHENEVRYYSADDEMVEEFNGSHRMVPRVYGGNNINGLLGAGGWVGSAADIARLVSAIDKNPVVRDILSSESIDSLTAFKSNDKLSRGWSDVDSIGKWTRTGTLGSTHALVQRYPDGECWVIFTNTGVWIGHKFSNELQKLIESLRQDYGSSLPRRTLWK